MRALQEFDLPSVRCGAAALALWSRNADRMRALAALTRGLPIDCEASPEGSDAAGPRPPITPARWRAWFHSDDSRAIRDIVPDGVFDAPTYVEAELLGSRFRLLGGYLDAPDVHYRLWTQALRHVVLEAADEYVGAALRLMLATAGVSEMVVRCAEIEFELPHHLPDGVIEIPNDEVYERLCRGLEIPLDELRDGVVQPKALRSLIVTPTTAPEDRWRTPIVAYEDRLLLAGPRDVLLAGLLHAVEVALRSPSWEPLLRRLNVEAVSLVEQIAADMDWELVEREGTTLLLRFDSDKLAAVDFLAGPITPFGTPIATGGRDVEMAYERLAARHARDPRIQLGLVVLLGDGRAVKAPLPEPMEPPFGPWIVSLGGLRLIGDAFRLDPLQIWRLLRRMPPQPWPDDTELLEVVGLLRRRYESGDAVRDPLATGLCDSGIEHLHRRALVMASRHTAPRPDGEGWVTVSRWPGTPDRAVFAPEEDIGPFALVVRGPRRYCWIVAGAEVAADHNDALGVLIRLVAFWAGRLVEAGWLIVAEEMEPNAEGIELGIRIVVSFEDTDGPALAIGGAPGLGRLVFGPAFLHVMARGDNDADRMVVGALAHWWLGASAGEVAIRLLDHVAPKGHATFAIWPNPLARRLGNAIEDVSPVSEDERFQVHLDVAANLVDESHILYAHGEQAGEILARVNRLVVALVDHEIERCSPDLLLELVRVHERVRRLQEAHSVSRPSAAAMPDSEPLTGGLDAGELGALAIRWLIERVGAHPPAGDIPPSRTMMERLRALAEALVEWGVSSDAAHAGLATLRLSIGRMLGCRVMLEGPVVAARNTVDSLMTAAAPLRGLEQHAEWWGEDTTMPVELRLDEPVNPEDKRDASLDHAMEMTWGYRLEELMRACAALMEHADEQPAAAAERRAAVMTLVARKTAIESARVEAIVDSLILGPCEPYDPLTKEHKAWSTNRDRSYLRRPLVELADGRLAWSAGHMLSSARYLATLIASGRLRAQGVLRDAVRAYSGALDRGFELQLRDACRGLGWDAKLRVKRLGGRKLASESGNDIGDIDVLAFNQSSGRVCLLDAKRISPALVPNDMRREARALGRDVGKHLIRLEWVNAHREDLEIEIGQPAAGDEWAIDAALVSDRPLAGAYLASLRLPVWPIDELVDRLEPSG